jgi:asparagine synthase (glutamine-hydrolysing)
LSKLARSQVTVSLSGDGGDELFGGYNRYFWSRDLWRVFKWIPAQARSAMAKGIESIRPGSWDYLYQRLLPGKSQRHRLFGDKLHKLAEVMPAETPEEMYALLVSYWRRPSELVIGAKPPHPISDPHVNDIVSDPTLRMMLLDTITYLPDDILVKLDRASMAVSLESRVPFLDHRLVEYAWKIPLALKIDGNIGKAILRSILYKYVPRELIERPKQGFSVPIDSWLRGPLRDWSESLLDERRLREEGYLDASAVRTKWDEHLSGKRNWQYLLWCVLMLQQWLAHHGQRTPERDLVAAVA